jgi:hypothetical protein
MVAGQRLPTGKELQPGGVTGTRSVKKKRMTAALARRT